MKKTLLAFALIGLIASGCGKKTETSSDSDSSAGNTKDHPKEVASDTQAITLKEAKGEKIGFTIQLPEGATEVQNTPMYWTYNFLLADGIHGITVNVERMATKIETIEDAVKYATNGVRDPGIKEQKAVGADFLVVKNPEENMSQDFWYFTKTKNGFIGVKCFGPPAYQDVCLQIVTSLKSI
jgi:hypothetical protein